MVFFFMLHVLILGVYSFKEGRLLEGIASLLPPCGYPELNSGFRLAAKCPSPRVVLLALRALFS